MFKLTIILILITRISFIQNITHESIILTAPQSEEVNYHPNNNNNNRNDETARKFLQFYSSFNPVVLLVDDVKRCHGDAITFFKNVHQLTPKIQNVNFMLMKFNASGATTVLETTRNDRRRFEEALRGEISENPSSFLGYDNVTRSAVFFGILNAANVLPPNSGIVVFMKREIEDEALAQHAFLEIAKKRIQVFVIWAGKNEEYLLKELAVRSHGIFLVTSETDLSARYYENFLGDIGSFTSASVILSRKNLKGESNLKFPIDSDITGVHISITPNVSLGILTTPKGYKIDVLRYDDVPRFSVGSFMRRENGMHEIHLNTTTPGVGVGLWSLRVGNARALYNITIYAHTKLTTNAIVTINQTGTVGKTGIRNKIIKLGVVGDVSSVNNISFVNEDGQVLSGNLKYTLDKNLENLLTENIDSIETNEKKELNITVEEVPKGPFYAVVTGKDGQGNDFRRLSYVRNTAPKEFYLPPLTVEVGLGSELITQSYRQPQLFFEVTNNGNTPSLVGFFCRADQRLLLSMSPWYKWINAQETATVRVTLTTRQGAFQDLITFTAWGPEVVNKKVIVHIGSVKDDRTDPDLHYLFTSDCTDVLFGSCQDGTWTVEVKAKDKESGLLQVSSIPRGIHFPNGYTAGTTEEVTGYFSESCCNPDLKIVAYDRQNNRYTRHINAYRANLGPGAIAAIVLGVLFLILIIVAIVFLCKYCCKKCNETGRFDLPVYQGPLTSRRT